MPIRVATFGDLKTIAEVLAAAFDGEELNTYFFPHRKQYPADYVKAWYQVVLDRWADYSNIWLVSYIENSTTRPFLDKEVVITGAAQWGRVGEGSDRLWGVYSWDPRKILSPILQKYLSLERIVVPNKAIGTSPDEAAFRKWDFGPIIFPFIEHFYNEPAHRKNHWQLDLLGVHPDHRKYGHGSELIAWGIQRASRDKIPAVVIMADGLEEYHRKQGFEVLVGYAYKQDLYIEERLKDGSIVKKQIPNPLRQRNIGGGGIAWTKDKDV